MEITGLGINVHPDRVRGEWEILKEELEYFQELGYDYAEISPDAVDLIYHGKLHPAQMRRLRALLGEFSLRYTVHAPRVLDLRDLENLELQKEIFRSCIRLAAEIGAEIFVYHYGRRSEDQEREARLLEAMLELADFAAGYGVQICVENIEIDTVANVVEFVEQVAEEKGNVGMTLDIGHAFLASRRFGFDLLEAVRQASPYVRHLHLSDNFGHFEETRLRSYEQYKLIPYPKLLQLGRGDLHLPPGWGEAPIDEVLSELKGYRGILLLEYYSHRYRPQGREILQAARRLVERHSLTPRRSG